MTSENVSKLISKKFIFCMVALLLASALMAGGMLTATVYGAIVGTLATVLSLADVADNFLGKSNGTNQ